MKKNIYLLYDFFKQKNMASLVILLFGKKVFGELKTKRRPKPQSELDAPTK